MILGLCWLLAATGLFPGFYSSRAHALVTNTPAAGLIQRRDRLEDHILRVSSPTMTTTLFMPVTIVPDCGNVFGRVVQSGRPVSDTYVAVLESTLWFRYPLTRYSTTTDAEGNFSFDCIQTTGTQYFDWYHIQAYGNPVLGQPATFSSYTFTLKTHENVVVPPLTFESIQLIDPQPGSTKTLPYTFVWTSTYTNATAYSVILFFAPGGFIFSFGNMLTGTITSHGSSSEPFSGGYGASVRVFTPNGYGESASNSITLIVP